MFRFKNYIAFILNPSQPPFTKGGETPPPFGKGDLSASGGLRGDFQKEHNYENSYSFHTLMKSPHIEISP